MLWLGMNLTSGGRHGLGSSLFSHVRKPFILQCPQTHIRGVTSCYFVAKVKYWLITSKLYCHNTDLHTHAHTCVQPAGLLAEYEHYLFEKIREFSFFVCVCVCHLQISSDPVWLIDFT